MKTALFVSTCLMATFCAVATPIQALGGTGDTGRVALESNQDDHVYRLNDVYTMNADGADKVRLTTGASSPFWGRYPIDPAFSPDGTKIVFVGTGGENGSELWTMNADGSGLTRITNTRMPESSPSWSPNGTQIVFSRPDDRFRSNPELYVVNADGTGYRQLTDDGEFQQTANIDPDWLADGRIVFSSNRNGTDYDLFLLSSGGGDTELTDYDGNEFQADGSPDGTKVAFNQNGPGDPSDVYVINVNGTGRTRLTSHPGRDERPSWSPDGSKLAFDSDRLGFTVQIFTMNANGSNVEQISLVGSDNRAPSWGPAEAPPPVDATAPTIDVRTPVDGAIYRLNESVTADYACADEAGGSGVATCIGSVPNGARVDTSTAGTSSFSVTAVDGAGNSTTAEAAYTVEAPDTTPPTITIVSPEDGATYQLFDQFAVEYECADEASGSGVVYCEGDLPNGDRVDTGTPGSHQFSVLAQDGAGNEVTETITYDVIDTSPPTIDIAAPTEGATYDEEQVVLASYDCVDPGGLASCAGTVPDGSPIDTNTGGAHVFSVTATDRSGHTLTVTRNYTVRPRDRSAPLIDIRTPAEGAEYEYGEIVHGDFSCADEPGGSGLQTCTSNLDFDDEGLLDTSTLGAHVFTVEAADRAGNRSTRSVQYTVVDRVPPAITIRVPDEGATYTLDSQVFAWYFCRDVASDVASCAGDVASGAPIDTSTPGDHTFTVRAVDRAGNVSTASTAYSVDCAINGTPGNDRLFGTNGDDVICGFGGDDTIAGGVGHDRIYGGPGADFIHGEHLEIGRNARVGDDVLYGGDGDDQLFGDIGSNGIFGGDGQDALYGSPGTDLYQGGPGEDSVQFHVTNDPLVITLDGNANDGAPGERDNVALDVETVSGSRGNDRIVGNEGPNGLRGGSGDDTVVGAGGDDILHGGDGTNALYGEDGNDWVQESPGREVAFLGEGNDFAEGGAGDDSLIGESGNDQIRGGDGTDLLNGGLGGDALYGGNAGDELRGGPGSDHIDGQAGLDFLLGQEDGDLVLGSAGTDALVGGPGGDTLDGGPGRDGFIGGDGDDRLIADGEIRFIPLVGFDDDDVLSGGDGVDTVSYLRRSFCCPVTVTLDGVANDGGQGERDFVGPDVENAEGGEGADLLIGNDLANRLAGLEGNDRIEGRAGDDSLFGGAGDDRMEGGLGADFLFGETGDDTIDSRDGAGTDYVDCGEGNGDGFKVDVGDSRHGCEIFLL